MNKSFQMIAIYDRDLVAVENGFGTKEDAMQYATENYDAVMNWRFHVQSGGMMATALDSKRQFNYRIYVCEESHDRDTD